MMHVEIGQGTLTLRFAPWARLFTRTGVVSVPLAAIAEVHHLDRPLAALTGFHSGLLVSGVVKLGTWTSPGGVRRLAAARREVPGVRVVLKDRVAGYDELILGVPDARRLHHDLTAARA
ncbi:MULTISPECIES: hypothetical protein [Nonomuraea]|uniref:Uncharacterized protein n=1 Tax=Nonomuraea ferruginea TaxID=46174 RepID=A0ABT4T5F8_9ACTN|nr:hypothetical protein [Nonomuraea ferruginea]MDA0644743.1 hypothetical protein [Nonomuraea ferruginea]